nr:hypothetical protein CFP56_04114 [Quercus suber]
MYLAGRGPRIWFDAAAAGGDDGDENAVVQLAGRAHSCYRPPAIAALLMLRRNFGDPSCSSVRGRGRGGMNARAFSARRRGERQMRSGVSRAGGTDRSSRRRGIRASYGETVIAGVVKVNTGSDTGQEPVPELPMTLSPMRFRGHDPTRHKLTDDTTPQRHDAVQSLGLQARTKHIVRSLPPLPPLLRAQPSSSSSVYPSEPQVPHSSLASPPGQCTASRFSPLPRTNIELVSESGPMQLVRDA